MATVSCEVPSANRTKTFIERWYFTAIAIVMIVVSLVGFMPSIVNPAGRRAPLTLLAAAHGAVFLAWLLLFLAQSLLVATARVGWHRRLGLTSVVLLALIIPLTTETSIAIMRRGYDLSGDSHISPHPKIVGGRAIELDAPTDSAFNVFGLLEFTLLATTAIGFRRRPEIHKRLMLFANISLMVVPVQHLMGHIPSVVLTPATVLVPYSIFILAGVARDYLTAKRIHRLSIGLAIGLFVSQPLVGAVIGPSGAWHSFVAWIAR